MVESRQKAGFKPVKQRPPTPPPASTVAEDEQPTVVPLDEPKRPAGGLQTASELAESTKRAKEKEARKRERALQAIEASQGAGETVYRDATGRARDTKAEKAEARRQAARDMEKNMERMEWGKGLVQRQDKERRKAELEAEAAAPVARYANDARLNAQQKEQMRWNDPMANMLSNKSSGSGSKKKERPTYKGPPPPPNRFGIRPGYRCRSFIIPLQDFQLTVVLATGDGVDRSNGFERKFLQRGNAAKVVGLFSLSL